MRHYTPAQLAEAQEQATKRTADLHHMVRLRAWWRQAKLWPREYRTGHLAQPKYNPKGGQ